MEVNVIDPSRGLALQARCVEVIDVVVLAVEQVVNVDVHSDLLRERVADARIDERRRPRAYTVVFYERPRAEVAPAQRAEPVLEMVHRQTRGHDLLGRARYAVSRRIEVR